jgi:hypothetical protein
MAWLVPIAFLPQFYVFQLPTTRYQVSREIVSITLLCSQLILLIFVWFNRRLPGFSLLGAGLVLNMLVIAINGGLMPISPETVIKMVPEAPMNAWGVGLRFGNGKDMVLPIDETRVWWLSDRLVLPGWFPYRVAFSVGDIFIAIGAFRLMWSLGEPAEKSEK